MLGIFRMDLQLSICSVILFNRAPSTGLAAETVSGVNVRRLTNSTDYNTIMSLIDSLDMSDAQTNV